MWGVCGPSVVAEGASTWLGLSSEVAGAFARQIILSAGGGCPTAT